MVDAIDGIDEICSWCNDSGILLHDFNEHLGVGDECPACTNKVERGLTLEEFEDQLRDQGYTDEEIREELEKIEAQNEDLGC